MCTVTHCVSLVPRPSYLRYILIPQIRRPGDEATPRVCLDV